MAVSIFATFFKIVLSEATGYRLQATAYRLQAYLQPKKRNILLNEYLI
jgi:hypothetical protein